MKKITALCISIWLMFSLCFTCSAEAVFETAGELYQSWAGVNNFPDYVCGVCSTDGGQDNLTISVLDTKEGEDGKAEILELVKDDSTVTFAYGEYSRDYLTQTQKEIDQLFKTNEKHGIVGTALSDNDNRIILTVIDEYENNKESKETLNNLKSKYGDVFIISYAKQPVFSDDSMYISSTDISIHDDRKSPDYTTVVLLIILIFSITFMVVRKRRQALLETDTGEVVALTELSEKDIENLVKGSDITYPDALDKKIADKINIIK